MTCLTLLWNESIFNLIKWFCHNFSPSVFRKLNSFCNINSNNSRQNIWNKAKKWSKIGQHKKTLISVLIVIILKFSFWERDWALCPKYHVPFYLMASRACTKKTLRITKMLYDQAYSSFLYDWLHSAPWHFT